MSFLYIYLLAHKKTLYEQIKEFALERKLTLIPQFLDAFVNGKTEKVVDILTQKREETLRQYQILNGALIDTQDVRDRLVKALRMRYSRSLRWSNAEERILELGKSWCINLLRIIDFKIKPGQSVCDDHDIQAAIGFYLTRDD